MGRPRLLHRNQRWLHRTGGTYLWALVLLLWVLSTPAALAASPIVLDGQFLDWIGQPNVSDAIGDCAKPELDLTKVLFATNPNDSTAYFMTERLLGINQPLGLRLYIDTNNNGSYSEPTDRIVKIRYAPDLFSSQVDVDIHTGTDAFLKTIANDVDWGEGLVLGARHVEWGVSFADMGITAGQPIRMYLESRPGSTSGGNRCDITAEVQWSPANALGLPLLALVLCAGAIAMSRRKRGIRHG
jgi:hypothetical protein